MNRSKKEVKLLIEEEVLKLKANNKIAVSRYNAGLAKIKFKSRRRRLFTLSFDKCIDGNRIYAESHCVLIKLPAKHELAYGLAEGVFFGSEGLVLVTAVNVNPVLFGRE